MHTKRNVCGGYFRRFPKHFKNNVFCGSDLWRNFLLNEILGRVNVRKTLLIFQRDKYAGELGFMPYALKYKSNDSALKIWSHKIKKAPKRCKFFAGTIFAIRANLLRIIQNIYTESDFEIIQKDEKFSKNAYGFEGFLGSLVQFQKRKLKGVNPFSNPLILSLLSHKKLFPLFKFYCNKFIFKKELIK